MIILTISPECPDTSPTPGKPCKYPGELQCRYKPKYEHACCGRCAKIISFSCKSINSASGLGLWEKPKPSPPCPADCCGSRGEEKIVENIALR